MSREIQAHVEECPACLAETTRLERLQTAIQAVLKERASELAFEPFWQEVRRRLSERPPWYREVLDRVRLAPLPRRLAWAIPGVIVVVLGLYSAGQFLPGWSLQPVKNNRTIIDSIDAHGYNVAVFREYETRTTLIWLFENQEHNEPRAASSQGDPSF